jgi:predicted ATP-grasp superfamily ATP-dependent carboligase
MTPEKKLLIVDENVAPLTLVVVRCLGRIPGFQLHVLSLGKLKYPQFRFSKYLKSCVVKPFSDEEEAYNIIKNHALKIGADMIIPVNEKTVKIISTHKGDCLGYCSLPPVPELDTLNLVRHKWNLYRWLYENKYSSCKPVLIKEVVDEPEKLNNLTFPLLVKPNWGSGGSGIRYVKTLEDLRKILPEIIDPSEFVIQPVIPGYDIDISLLAQNGEIIAHAIQKSIESKSKLVYAKAIQFLNNDELLNITRTMIKHLNFSGIAHLDFRYDSSENNYKLVDFNARYWSSLLGSLNAGINFPYLAVTSNGHGNKYGYNCSNYYIDSNLMKMMWKRIPVNNTELVYNMEDPLPFFAEYMVKGRYHLRKLLGLKI